MIPFLKREHRIHPEYRQGLRDQSSVAMGIGAWGLMTGVAMVQSGLSPLEAVLMTIIVFAGSAQLAAVPMMVAGAPLWVVLAAAFCVNLRFVVFSAHLRPYLMHLPRSERLVTGFFTGDLSYVFFSRRYTQPSEDPRVRAAQQAYLLGNCAGNWVAWTGLSLLGVALANVIPVEWGLGFAGILALLGVTCSLASSRLRVLSAGVAGAAAVAAWALPLKLNILVAIASAVALCLTIDHLRAARRGDGHV